MDDLFLGVFAFDFGDFVEDFGEEGEGDVFVFPEGGILDGVVFVVPGLFELGEIFF